MCPQAQGLTSGLRFARWLGRMPKCQRSVACEALEGTDTVKAIVSSYLKPASAHLADNQEELKATTACDN